MRQEKRPKRRQIEPTYLGHGPCHSTHHKVIECQRTQGFLPRASGRSRPSSTQHGKTEGTLRSHQATFQELDFTQTSSCEDARLRGRKATREARRWPVAALSRRLQNPDRWLFAGLCPSFGASQRSRSHPTGTQVRSFLSHLFVPMPAPRPHREGASGD